MKHYHRTLNFLKKCVITSTRVALWMLEIEQWELEIQHIRGIDNTLADILSRNPPQCNNPNTANLRQRHLITVNAVNWHFASSVKGELRNLAILQNREPRLLAIKHGLTTQPTTGTKYLLNNEVLYCKGVREGMNWQAMLPECLEQNVMPFVHTTLGHLGSDQSYAEIKGAFHFRNLGGKLRKFTAACDLCQRTEHMNRANDVAENITSRNVQENCVLFIYMEVCPHQKQR